MISPSTKIRIGSRKSPLAQAQVKEFLSLLASAETPLEYEIIYFETAGDKDKTTPLTVGAADNFFTDTLDQALLNNDIDLAVHSAKDLPKDINPNLAIFALTSLVDESDAFVGKTSLRDFPPGSRVGTSSLLRKENVLAINPNVVIVEIRGTINERIALIENGTCDGIIVATAALKRLGLEKLIKDIMPWETTACQGQLAIVGRTEDTQLQTKLANIDVRKKYGKVILAGAGPGDPQLITIKAINALKKADVVFYDYLIPEEVLEYAVRAEKIYVGKRKGIHATPQQVLSRMLRDEALKGRLVVRLKGGDPLVFGRGADEITYLRSYHIETEVIPGISSATGIPSSFGIPLTARGIASSVAFVSGHSENENISEEQSQKDIAIPKADTIVFLMGLTKLENILATLRRQGWSSSTPMIVISKGTRFDERTVEGTIETIFSKVREANLEAPALIVVGNIVKFRNLSSNDNNAILYTGTAPQKYRALGKIIHLPMIKIEKNTLARETVLHYLQQLDRYDIILMTSRFGVKFFFKLLKEYGVDEQRLNRCEFIAIGEETAAALEKYGIAPSLTANTPTSEGMLKALREKYTLNGKHILFPRSALPNPFLTDELRQCGASVDVLTVYNNIRPEKRELPIEPIDRIVFTSPSTVRNFLADYGRIPQEWRILSRGPLTTQTLKDLGYDCETIII